MCVYNYLFSSLIRTFGSKTHLQRETVGPNQGPLHASFDFFNSIVYMDESSSRGFYVTGPTFKMYCTISNVQIFLFFHRNVRDKEGENLK